MRTLWDDEAETWYFSILDIIAVLTDSVNPTDYFKKMRKRDESLASFVGTNCPQVAMKTESGVMRKTLVGDMKCVLRVIQSIPSPKAEPFKQWMAQVASDRLDQMQDPEMSIQQAMVDYKRLGYSDNWINQRLKSMEVRKELTDEWERRGIKKGQEYATLTDIITLGWSGMTTRQYKQYKGLKTESLRDNMTNLELVLNMLAEATTTEISKERKPRTAAANRAVAAQGGRIAGNTRREIEAQTGKRIVSPLTAKQALAEKTAEGIEHPEADTTE